MTQIGQKDYCLHSQIQNEILSYVLIMTYCLDSQIMCSYLIRQYAKLFPWILNIYKSVLFPWSMKSHWIERLFPYQRVTLNRRVMFYNPLVYTSQQQSATPASKRGLSNMGREGAGANPRANFLFYTKFPPSLFPKVWVITRCTLYKQPQKAGLFRLV